MGGGGGGGENVSKQRSRKTGAEGNMDIGFQSAAEQVLPFRLPSHERA